MLWPIKYSGEVLSKLKDVGKLPGDKFVHL